MNIDSKKNVYVKELSVDDTGITTYKDWECAVDRLSQVICLLNNQRKVLRVNRVIESWGLHDVKKANGLDLHELMHPGCDDPRCSLAIWLDWAWQQLKAQDILDGDLWDETLDRFINIRLVKISPEKESCVANPTRAVLVTIDDIGSYKRSETEQYNLSVKLINAQEQERKRIALDLHDGISQTLSAIKFNLEAEISKHTRDLPELNSGLTGVVGKMRGAMEDLRRISMDLWPSMLDDLGILSTINWLVRECQTQVSDICWNLDVQLEESDISELQKITIFRILQESLNNACKYSEASVVDVSLLKVSEGILLKIQDNGRGFDLQKVHQLHGIGLRSMQERVDLSQGKLDITSSDSGTVIQVFWSNK